jgi:tetratricopeptide (TPR) repeat protein
LTYSPDFSEQGLTTYYGEKVMRKRLGLLFLPFVAFAAFTFAAQSRSAVPELPRLTLDNFSPGIREQIKEAYSFARNHADDAGASGRLGMVLQTYGLLQEAAICYQRAIQLEPNSFPWTYYLGAVEADQGHCDTATATLRLALRIEPNYVPAKLRLAKCLLASADWDASGKLYSEIVEQYPDNADAYYGLGRVRSARRDLGGASEAYRKATELFPDFGAAHYALALTNRTLGRADQAEEQFRLYEKNKTGVPPAGDPLLGEVRALNHSATYQVQYGAELERQGKLEESAAAHEKALEIDPNLVQAHINLIQLYGRLGQFEKAEEHYRASIRIDPGSAESYYNYGVLLLSAEKYSQAEEAFRKTIEINPFHAGAHNNLGYLLERRSNFPEAEAEYRKAIENKPSDREAHFNLGRILVNQKKFQEGIQELKKTIEPEDENTPRYVYALGAAFARSGDRQNALRYIREARDGAAARGQSTLLASIERDLRTLEAAGNPQ